jgi:hypothetical protein
MSYTQAKARHYRKLAKLRERRREAMMLAMHYKQQRERKTK